MVPLVVEGDTLGEKHRNYNKIFNETTQKNIPEIDYEKPDLDNLLKIDIACKNRNVDYIIKVLQCEDMLYVSRAIKRSTWLITETQYTYIVNPNYLNDQLSPTMMSKAFNKFLLHVRLNLKDESRVEEFFNYYEEKDLKAALKWLPNCSIQLTEKILQKHLFEIPNYFFKRLSKKSITFLSAPTSTTNGYYQRQAAVETAMFYLKTNTEQYLNIIETYDSTYTPIFGPKATEFIMKKCGERVMQNLEEYSSRIHVPTFAKFIKQEDLKGFITKNITNYNMKPMFEKGNINFFVNRIPIESRLDFVKGIIRDNKQNDMYYFISMYFCGDRIGNSENLYRLYLYGSFENTFVVLKKLIRSEPNREKRTSMFEVMLTCATKDLKNIRSVLKYYRENHINEAVEYIAQFVDLVLSYANTHYFDEETWGYLNDLFCIMNVYNESNTPDQNYIKSIILYNIIHDERIPDVIEKKFSFDTFKMYHKKLLKEEEEKLFLYLYNYLTSKIDTLKINNNKKAFSETVDLLTNVLHLLSDWNKELKDFAVILDKIKEIIQLNRKNKWSEDISVLYNIKKSWKRLLFAESIVLNPTQETCIHALKHSPELLQICKKEVESLCLSDEKRRNRFLKKVRIYWSQSLANTYKNLFINRIDQKNCHKAAVIGLCTLLPKNDLANLLQKYTPNESKIDWTKFYDVELNCQKHVASSLYLARPQPTLAAVLLYAKGDYLQYVLPSLNAILYNVSSIQTREHLNLLLDSPVYLQKYGIEIAFSRLKHDELKNLLFDKWKSNRNGSIRAAIFNYTLDFLCNENEPTAVKNIWDILSILIDNLTPADNKSIYTKLSKVEKVPSSLRPEFWMKSYKFLKSLPSKVNCKGLLNHLKNQMDKVMDFLDVDFVAEIFLESFDENFSTKPYDFQYLVVKYVLRTKTEEVHLARYNKVLVPILERSFAIWNKSYEGTNYVRKNLSEILSSLDGELEDIVLQKKMILPIPMFTDILKRLRENLPMEENYILITTRQLSLDCVKLFDKVLKTNEQLASTLLESMGNSPRDKYMPLYAETAAELGKLCVNYLKEDVSNHFPSIYKVFVIAFDNIFEKLRFDSMNKLIALKAFLECKDFIPGYMFVLESVPSYVYDNEKALKSELLNAISTHPSKEVKMYCYLKKCKNN